MKYYEGSTGGGCYMDDEIADAWDNLPESVKDDFQKRYDQFLYDEGVDDDDTYFIRDAETAAMCYIADWGIPSGNEIPTQADFEQILFD